MLTWKWSTAPKTNIPTKKSPWFLSSLVSDIRKWWAKLHQLVNSKWTKLLTKAVTNPTDTLTSIWKATYKASPLSKSQLLNSPEIKAVANTITNPRKVIKEGIIWKKWINLIWEALSSKWKSIRKWDNIFNRNIKKKPLLWDILVWWAVEQLWQFLSTPFQTSEKNKKIIHKIKTGKLDPLIWGSQIVLWTWLATASTIWKPMAITANTIWAALKAGWVDESMNKKIEEWKISTNLVNHLWVKKENAKSLADSIFNVSMGIKYLKISINTKYPRINSITKFKRLSIK